MNVSVAVTGWEYIKLFHWLISDQCPSPTFVINHKMCPILPQMMDATAGSKSIILWKERLPWGSVSSDVDTQLFVAGHSARDGGFFCTPR
jgi:hypothetical protein